MRRTVSCIRGMEDNSTYFAVVPLEVRLNMTIDLSSILFDSSSELNASM